MLYRRMLCHQRLCRKALTGTFIHKRRLCHHKIPLGLSVQITATFKILTGRVQEIALILQHNHREANHGLMAETTVMCKILAAMAQEEAATSQHNLCLYTTEMSLPPPIILNPSLRIQVLSGARHTPVTPASTNLQPTKQHHIRTMDATHTMLIVGYYNQITTRRHHRGLQILKTIRYEILITRVPASRNTAFE